MQDGDEPAGRCSCAPAVVSVSRRSELQETAGRGSGHIVEKGHSRISRDAITPEV
jgi:hypothetical protein